MFLERRDTRRSICPQTFPRVENDAPIDELGFTCTERVTLKRAWELIGRNTAYGSYINCEFFVHYENLLDCFRDKQGRFELDALSRHPHSVLHIHEIIIENLDRPAFVTTILKVMDIHHGRTGVTREAFAFYTEVVKDYQLKLLARYTSPTLVSAFNKLANVISNVRA